jgi:beta-glucanase (GH16 family)
MATPATPNRTRHRRWLAATIGPIAASALLGVTVVAYADAPPAPESFTVVFTDEFVGPAGALPDATTWDFDLGTSYPGGPANWGTGEIQTYTRDPANVSLDGNGNLLITPRRDGDAWTSARIETKRADFTAPEGGIMQVEARIQLPDPSGADLNGYWPAFWMLGSPYRGNFQNWPGIGEIDVMENVNGTGEVFSTLHCGVAPGGPCNENIGIAGDTNCDETCQNGFHVYRLEWDRTVTPQQLRWSADGVTHHTVSESQVPAATWAQATGHGGFFLLLNVAVGGAFPNAGRETPVPSVDTTPGRAMVVDYVRVIVKQGA